MLLLLCRQLTRGRTGFVTRPQRFRHAASDGLAFEIVLKLWGLGYKPSPAQELATAAINAVIISGDIFFPLLLQVMFKDYLA